MNDYEKISAGIPFTQAGLAPSTKGPVIHDALSQLFRQVDEVTSSVGQLHERLCGSRPEPGRIGSSTEQVEAEPYGMIEEMTNKIRTMQNSLERANNLIMQINRSI